MRVLLAANLTRLGRINTSSLFSAITKPEVPDQEALDPQEPQLRISSEFAGQQHPDLQTDEDLRQRQSHNLRYDDGQL